MQAARGKSSMLRSVERYMLSWKAYSDPSVNYRILTTMLLVGGLTLLVHLATAAKDLVTAYQFGTADELDAFLIAFLLPSLAIVVVGGSFSSSAIPIYIQVERRDGPEAAYGLCGNILAASIGVLLVVTILLPILVAPILALLNSSFTDEQLTLTRELFFILLPIVLLKGMATVWSAILNVTDRFLMAAIVPVITPVVTVAALLYLGPKWGIHTLALGAVGGAVLEVAILALYVRQLGIPLIPRWNGWTPPMATLMRQYGSVVVGGALMSSTALVDQAMAAMLGPGSVAALSYGGKVVSFVTVVGATALGTAVLPHFSRLVAASDWRGVRHTVRTYVRLILYVTVPLTMVAVWFSEPLVQAIFQRGAFTSTDGEVVSRVQVFLLLQVPFYIIGILIVRLISSLQSNSILMWGCVINFVLNVILNWVLMRWLDVAGIALSTALVIMVSSLYLGFMFMHVLRKREREQVFVEREFGPRESHSGNRTGDVFAELRDFPL